MMTNYENFTDNQLIIAYVRACIDRERYASEINSLFNEMQKRYNKFLDEKMEECK